MAHLTCMVHEAGRISRNRPAFLGGNIRINYGEWDLMVSATAVLLREAGIQRGARVAVFMESGWAQATLIAALIRVGAMACPLNTRLPVAGVHAQLEHIEATVLIARLKEESRAALDAFLCLDPDGLVSRELSSGQDADDFNLPINQSATIIFTSGSEGESKAALQTYGNHYYSAYGANLNIRLRSEDCWLLSLPLYHVGGLGILFRCMQSGAGVAVPNPGDPLERSLETFPVTHCSLVPAQLRDLLDKSPPKEVIKRLKAVVLGGSSIPPALLKEAQEKGWPVFASYGLTEMNAQVSACGPKTPPNKRMSAGKPLRYREVKINADGEILVKGATLFAGYVERGQVRSAVDAEGWFATGDLGHLDEDGYLYVTGRRDQLIISGGENIQPEEVEQALLDVPGVQRALVTSVPHTRFGERPVAFIDRIDPLTDQQLSDILRQKLPTYKIPDAFLDWPIEPEEGEGIKPSRVLFKKWAREQIPPV